MSDFSVHLFTHYASAFLRCGQRDEVEYASLSLASLSLSTRLQVLQGDAPEILTYFMIEGQNSTTCPLFLAFGLLNN